MECVRKGYTLPTMSDLDGRIIFKLVNEFSIAEIQEFGFNSKALNDIVNGIDINQYDLGPVWD